MNESDHTKLFHLTKKLKKRERKHKKDKTRKQKKRARKSPVHDVNPSTKSISQAVAEIAEPEEAFGPALPPHLLVKESLRKVEDAPVIGPVIPQGIFLDTPSDRNHEGSDIEEVFGPLPFNDGSLRSMTTAQIELEQRALEMKLAKFNPESMKEDANVREEWMLELPDVGLKAGLSSLKRTFHSKERPDFSDRSSWTKTPNSSNAPSTSKVTESSKSRAEQEYQDTRDAEQEKIAKKLKKKHKRNESLYEMHQKKLKKEKRKKESINGKADRRPFSRDIDLQVNKIDKNQTKSIVDKAKFLDSRFSRGNAKYL